MRTSLATRWQTIWPSVQNISSRVFKKEEGVSLLEYIQAQKMDLACKFFRETSLPISEVAARLGYSNFAYFSQIFRKATGSTPAAYRKAAGYKL